MPSSYKPGERKPKYGVNHQISDERYAWVNVEGHKFLILVGEDRGHGSDVVLFIPRPGKQPNLSISLTNFTSEELAAVSELFKTAFEWAQPVVERRDKEAQDAWDQGDDSHARNYRALPTVVYRKRPELQHHEGVLDGPEGVLESGGSVGGEAGGVRGTGNELVEPQSPALESQDDGTPSD